MPAVALATDGANPTCDPCTDVDGTIHPGPAWQTISGVITGEPNSELACYFCVEGGGTYTFSTCDGNGPGGADFDTAISIFEVMDTSCGQQNVCADKSCQGGSSTLLSTIAVGFHPNAGGEYIAVVDGSGDSDGAFTLAYMGMECLTPIADVTWGRIKADYR